MTGQTATEANTPQPNADNAEPEEKNTKNLTITQWAEDDRPREKLETHGAEALSTAELIAILIGSGNKKENAVDLMKRILSDCNNSIATLSHMNLNQLTRYNGQALQYHATRPAILNVYSTAGRLVKSERINGDGNLNLNDLNQGVFMYEVVSGGVRTASGKVLVK